MPAVARAVAIPSIDFSMVEPLCCVPSPAFRAACESASALSVALLFASEKFSAACSACSVAASSWLSSAAPDDTERSKSAVAVSASRCALSNSFKAFSASPETSLYSSMVSDKEAAAEENSAIPARALLEASSSLSQPSPIASSSPLMSAIE